MCETESCPQRQQLLKPSSHIYAANLEERTENEYEIENGVAWRENINSRMGKWVHSWRLQPQLIQRRVHSPHCQL